MTRSLLAEIEPQPMQRMPDDLYAEALSAPTGHAYAALVNGKPVAAAGVVELWKGRGMAWALLGANVGRDMLGITRAIRQSIDDLPFRRVEMAVDAEFPQAIRWAQMLGFRCETPEPMQHYTPDGRACYLYARVR